MEIYDGTRFLSGLVKQSDLVGNSDLTSQISVTQCCGARVHSIAEPHQCQKGLSFSLVNNKVPAELETKNTLLKRTWVNTYNKDFVVCYHEVVLDDNYSLLIGETCRK